MRLDWLQSGRSRMLLPLPLILALTGAVGPGEPGPAATDPPGGVHADTLNARGTSMENLTPVLYVEEIEPCLPFWTERLGFEVTGTVPQGDRLGFAMLQKGGVEIMYQTRASMEEDVPALADRPRGGAFLFIEVADIDAVEEALAGVERVVPRRTTPYGATEVGVLDPGGNVVTFAEFSGEQ